MSRHSHDPRVSSPAVQHAREREHARERDRRDGATGRVTIDATGPHVDLDVKVDELDNAPVDLHEDLPASWVGTLVDDGKEVHWGSSGDARLDVTLEREGPFVRVRGTARLHLVHPCVRCLNDVPFEVPLSLSMRLVERAPTAPDADLEHHEHDGDDHEGHPLGDAADLEDLDIASYEGSTIHFDEVLREQLFLELPMHPSCNAPFAKPKEACRYGETQKAIVAEQSRWVDPRWAGLAALRDKVAAAPAQPPPTEPAKPARSEAASVDDDDRVALPSRASLKRAGEAPEIVAPPVRQQKPASKKAASKKPASKKPASKKPASKKPASKKPASKTPASKKAASKKPASKTPASKTSAPKKPAPKKPAPKKPASKSSMRATKTSKKGR